MNSIKKFAPIRREDFELETSLKRSKNAYKLKPFNTREEASERTFLQRMSPVQQEAIKKLYAVESVSSNDFEVMSAANGHLWLKLPESINGTLLYFLLVEMNSPLFDIWGFFEALIVVGTPVYITYAFQLIFVVCLWQALFNVEGTYDDICTLNPALVITAVAVFLIFQVPAFVVVSREANIVLTSHTCAFCQLPNIYLAKIIVPISRRILTFLVVNMLEIIILCATTFVGIAYM